MEEIVAVYSAFKTCPKCGSNEGFWLAAKHDAGCVQCKHCGALFEICEVFQTGERRSKSSAGRIGILRRKVSV